MYQSFDSVREDAAAVLQGPRALGAAALFIEVDDLAAAEAKLPAGIDVVIRQRKTFYGSTETIVRDAAGNVVTLAQF